jgi:predicted lipid-binding transport protein (Tim44 family)
MQSSFDFTTLIFLGLAVFVAWKLRSVLGQKTGAEKPPVDPFRPRGPAQPEFRKPDAARQDGRTESRAENNVIRLPGAANDVSPGEAVAPPDRWNGLTAANPHLLPGLEAIAAQEANFDVRVFTEAAKSAYEYIVTAFATGDRKMLKSLLAKDVYDGFESAIVEREKRNEKAETTFVSIDKADLTNVEVKGNMAQITVRFASKLISATRDVAGKVVDGDPETVADVTDIWTFSRQLGSRDPNWLLVATEAVA